MPAEVPRISPGHLRVIQNIRDLAADLDRMSFPHGDGHSHTVGEMYRSMLESLMATVGGHGELVWRELALAGLQREPDGVTVPRLTLVDDLVGPMSDEDQQKMWEWYQQGIVEAPWKPTHRSVFDGSEIRMVDTRGVVGTAENENGDQFDVDMNEWEEIGG